MIGEVARGEADAALQLFSKSSWRAALVDFSATIQKTGIGILFA